MTEPDRVQILSTKMRQLAKEFSRWVQSELGDRSWFSATLVVRYAGDGAFTPAAHVQTLDQRLALPTLPNHLTQALMALDPLRTALAREWFSLHLTLNPTGQANITLGYDAAHLQDQPSSPPEPRPPAV